MNCQICNHSIKRTYTWNDRVMGIECWKKIALPEILRQREEKWAERKRAEWQKSFALVEAIKQKDFSKIKSEFKVKFLKSLVSQFEEKGFISEGQKEVVYGTHQWNGSFYDNGMFNTKDRMNQLIAEYNVGLIDKEFLDYRIETFYNSDKEKAYILEGIKEN